MIKVTFFIEPEWAFGSIHYELCKRLRTYGIDASVIAWNKSYTMEEMKELDDVTDIFVTTPHGWRFLGHSYAVIPHEKTCIVAHSKLDIAELIYYHGFEDYAKFKKYTGVSTWLQKVSKELGVPRECGLTRLGINYDAFFAEPSDKLRVIGYAGTYHEQETEPLDDVRRKLVITAYHNKRAYLIKSLAQKFNLSFSVANGYHNTYATMPGYYRNIDCLIAASLEEGAGLPVFEAGAAGKLVMSTNTGHWIDRSNRFGGHTLPFDPDQFIDMGSSIISKYLSDNVAYRNMCYQIRDHARTYDWSYVIEDWVELLS